MINNKDNLGNELTKEQIEYFKNTKIVDKNNNLLVCYHGSPTPYFKEFNPKDNKSQFGRYKFGDHNVNYFTTDKHSASSYTEFGYDDGTIFECYINITNPFIVDNKTERQFRSSFNINDNRVRQKQIDLFDKIFNKWKDSHIYYPETSFEQLNNDLRKLNYELRPSEDYKDDVDEWDIEYYDLWFLGSNHAYGQERIKEFQYTTDELFSDDMYEQLRDDIIGDVEEKDYIFTTDDIVRYVLEMDEDYDGIIISDILDSKSLFSDYTTDVITLKSSNQIKSISNKNPSSSNRIDEVLVPYISDKYLLWKGPEYSKEPKIDKIRLYHQTDKKNIPSIIKNGLQGKYKHWYDNPGGNVIWASSDQPTDSSHWNYGNCVFELDLPKDFDMRKVNSSDYNIYQDIPVEYINALYLKTPYVPFIMQDFQNTLDIDKSIDNYDKYRKGELKESQELDDLIRDTIEFERKYRKGETFKLPQDLKDKFIKDYPNYEFKVVRLEDVVKKNQLDNFEHGMYSRRTNVWGTNPELYQYMKHKESQFNPIRLSQDLRIIDGNHRIWALYNNGYTNAEVLVYRDSKLTEALLLEVSRRDLINKSKKGADYSPSNQGLGKNRWERKKWSRVANSTREFNSIDMNTFFKKDILIVNVPVQGETDNYIVKIKFSGVVAEIQKNVQANNNKLDYRIISQALSKVFNSGDVYEHCSCLHPTTKIKLLDGTTPTVEEMKKRFDNGEKLYVYSTDENGDFKPGEVEKVWITKETTTFIKVTLDNNEEILTTPEHLYMLRDGSYICAENLKVGDSLMPLYFSNIARGYETIKLNSQTRKYVSTYKEVANYFKGDLIEEIAQSDNALNKEPKGVAIHHKDFNKNNNNPDNLEIMSSYDHWMYHANLMKNNWEDEEWRQKQIDRLKEYAKEWNAHPTEKMIEARKNNLAKGREHNYDPDWKPIQAEIMRNAMKNWRDNLSEEEWEIEKQKRYTDEWKENLSNSHKQLWEDMSEEEYQRRCQISKDTNSKIRDKLSVAQKEYWDNLDEETRNERIEMNRHNSKKSWEEHPEKHLTEAFKQARKNAFSYERTPEIELQRKITKISNILNKIISNGEIPSPETYEKYRTNGYPKYTKVFKDWKELSDYFKLNHKVVKVEFIELEETPVYDIAVKEWHNFYVDAGVVLHNCKDWQFRFNYWSTVQDFNSGKPENRPNRFTWTNSQDNMGGGCKHANLVIANLSWMMKVASVINNYIHYAESYMQRQFADIIFPKIYGVKYPDAVQLGMFDRQYLRHSKGVIDAINEYGSTRTRFKKTKPSEEPQDEVEIKQQPKQLSIFDKEIEDEDNKGFKKQSIYDYGVEEPEDVEVEHKGFKPKREQPKIQNKGFKKLSIFDEEEDEETNES